MRVNRRRELFGLLVALFGVMAIGVPIACADHSFSATRFLSDETFQELRRVGTGFATRRRREAVRLFLPLQDGLRSITLEPHDIRDPAFRAETTDRSGRRSVQSEVQLFRGTILGSDGDFVRLSLIEGTELEGLVRYNKSYFGVRPHPVSRQAVLVEELSLDDLQQKLGRCATLHVSLGVAPSGSQSPQTFRTAAATRRELQIATEADHEYVQAFGGASRANAHIISLLNGVDGIYEAQLGITITVTYQHTWSTPADPFTTSNGDQLLDQFTQFWESNLRAGRTYDVAHLWTGRNLDSAVVGVAYLGAVCTSASYGLSQNIGADSYDIPLSAHEIGHNLGADHDSCNGADRWIMCPYLVDNATAFSTSTKNQISSRLGQVSCLSSTTSPPPPPPAPEPSAPVLSSIGAKSVSEGSTLEFSLSAFDSDGDSYSFSVSGAPAGSSFSNGTFRFSPGYDAVSADFTIFVTFSVTDATGRSDSEVVPITIYNTNRAPTLTAPAPQSVLEGDLLTFSLSGTDPDGDSLTFFGRNTLPPGLIVLPSGQVKWRPAGDQQGTYTFECGTRDRFGGADTKLCSITVTDVTGVPPLPVKHTVGDLDGDGAANAVLFRHETGVWKRGKVLGGSVQPEGESGFGLPGDVPVLGDYDGDRITDMAVFRPSSSYWFYVLSGTGELLSQQFGQSGDLPVAADFDGDGRTDLGLYRGSPGEFIIFSSLSSGEQRVTLGRVGDIPVVADYNADGRADCALFRPSEGVWIRRLPTGDETITFGANGDIPVVGDYTGDGRADLAVYRPRESALLVQGLSLVAIGEGSEYPVPADFNGDGRTDLALYRIRDGVWSVHESGGSNYSFSFGTAFEVPVQPTQLFYGLANARGLARRREASLLSSITVHSAERKKLYTVNLGDGPSRSATIRKGTTLVRGDFNGDLVTDEALVRGGKWSIFYRRGNSFEKRSRDVRQFGSTADRSYAADFDGDGTSDLVSVRTSSSGSQWRVRESARGTERSFTLATPGARFVLADFSGDGRSDVAVLNGSEVSIFDGNSAKLFSTQALSGGGGVPRAADFDGDGRADLAIWTASSGSWQVFKSGGGDLAATLGRNGDTPVIGYFVSGSTPDFAVYRPRSTLLSVRTVAATTHEKRLRRIKGTTVVLGLS